MTEEIIGQFETGISFLTQYRLDVFPMLQGTNEEVKRAHLLSEALFFRMYRDYERFISSLFLSFCCGSPTVNGQTVSSILRTNDPILAEEVVRSPTRYLDWGKPSDVIDRAKIYLGSGFPIVELLPAFHSDLVNINRLRNYIAHDSDEAERGFRKVQSAYLTTPLTGKIEAGQFLLLRRARKNAYFLTYFLSRMEELAVAARSF